MNTKYARNVPLEKWEVRIKERSGFLMKNEKSIKEVLSKEYKDRDGTKPMDEMDWAYNAGWIEALEWVLGITHEQPKDITHLFKGANNDTIARSHKRLAKELGFGRKDNDVNSSNDSIRDSILYESQECFT